MAERIVTADAWSAFAAVRGGQVRREESAALSWPEMEAPRAFGNLRQTLRAFALGELAPSLERDRRSVWTPAPTDVAAFRQACAAGRWAGADERRAGGFLLGFEVSDAAEFCAWLDGERAQMHEAWRHAALRAAECALGAGRWGAAEPVADGTGR